MKERPMLFSGEMVRAVLEDRKTKTRRVVKFDESGRVRLGKRCWHIEDPNVILGCPYGQPGDRLWVREAWAKVRPFPVTECIYVYAESDNRTDYGGPWKPSIHMPRLASRINLEVVSVRVERVQDITDEDVFSEGIEPFSNRFYNLHTDRDVFARLWDSINLKRGYGWDANPLVWVIEFKRLP